MVRATLHDISRETGVSIYAVSQALAGKKGVSEETRKRVIDVAKRLGYVRNRAAANLKGATSHTIGVVTANGRNQYYATLLQGINEELRSLGYTAISNDAMRGGNYDAELERESIQGLLQQRVAGVIATYSLLPENIELLNKWQIPVVFVDTPAPEGFEDKPFIGVDNYFASRLVAEHLSALGHRSALLVAFPATWSARVDREAGFVETAKRVGLRTEVIETPNDPDAVAQLVINRLEQVDRPDCIYALNTILLQGVLKALARCGLRVPQDVSVIAFDEFDWAEHLDPPLTVVDQHIAAIGKAAGSKMVDILAGHESSQSTVVPEPELLVRSSTRLRE
jgi:LacI family transcriptional regulator